MQRNSGRTHPIHHPVKLLDNRLVILFVTVCTNDRAPILANEQSHALLVRCWHKADAYLVGRYAILPDHIHLFCAPAGHYPAASLQRWVQYWKSLVSREWPWSKQQPIWQRDFWDTQLRSGESYDEKWAYVKENPVRHNLVRESDEWPHQGKISDLPWHDR